jgi:hypothetical protein
MYAQFDSVENKVFNNDSIKYHIAHVTPSVYRNPDVVIGMYFVRIDNPKISNEFKEYLLKKDTTFWIGHLYNNQSDWATNLILYSIYRQSADQITYFYPTRDKWIKFKPIDIDFWRSFFKGKTKKTK